jgi:radical SAM superfamily enzyme YgiQ (UPF0313 family)
MAGFTCRPKRERSVESIVAQAQKGLAYRERIGLVGAAVSDYRAIDTLVGRLREIGARLSVSSLRVDPLSEPLLQALAESGVRTLTMAPEAGSERLRRAINKAVTRDDLLQAAERAARHSFAQLKLYFMLGLPGETDDDVAAIGALCQEAASRFAGQVTANVTPFVPKAHTPFQWAAMTPVSTLEARFEALAKHLQMQGIAVRGESPRWAAIQGVLARGDRRLSEVLTSVRGGSIRDWDRAMAACQVDEGEYLSERKVNEQLPWDFVRTGVDPSYLRKEWERTTADAPTTHCTPEGRDQCDARSGDAG